MLRVEGNQAKEKEQGQVPQSFEPWQPGIGPKATRTRSSPSVVPTTVLTHSKAPKRYNSLTNELLT
jgi:hypothetical protein